MSSKKIKILFLVLDMELGGLQRIVNLMIERIDKKRFTPYLCCLDRGGVFYDQLNDFSVKTFILNRRPGPFDWKLFIKLYRILKKEHINIIHSQNGCALYAALAGRLANINGIIHTDHGRLIPDRKGAIYEDRLSSIFFNKFIGVSEELTEYLAKEVKVSKKKLTTIINGVDTHKFTPLDSKYKKKLRKIYHLDEQDKVLGTVCRLDPIKNIEFILECMLPICNAIPKCKLLIAGDGSSKKSLVEYANNLGIEKNVLFIGPIHDVENILPIIDIYLSASFSEGTSMTILEAMSCGLPIIATDVGGNGRLVDSRNGYLFPLNDKNNFIDYIITIFNQPKKLELLGINSRKKVIEKFSIDNVVKKYEHLYLEIS